MRFRLTSFHKKSAFSATAHSENSESGRLSYFIQFFVWFHIVCDRYASDHAHFTFFNLIWPLSLSWVFEIQTNGYTEKLSYLTKTWFYTLNFKIFWCWWLSIVYWVTENDSVSDTKEHIIVGPLELKILSSLKQMTLSKYSWMPLLFWTH